MKKGDRFTIAGRFVMVPKADRRFRCGYRMVVAQPPRLQEWHVIGKVQRERW